MIQTRAYTTAVLRNIQSQRGLVDDVEAAVEVRMDRRRLLDAHGKTFAFVLEEQVLWTRVADEETMVGQLGHLLTIITTKAERQPRDHPTDRAPRALAWRERAFDTRRD